MTSSRTSRADRLHRRPCGRAYYWRRRKGQRGQREARPAQRRRPRAAAALLPTSLPGRIGPAAVRPGRGTVARLVLARAAPRQVPPLHELVVIDHPEGAEVVLVADEALVKREVRSNRVLYTKPSIGVVGMGGDYVQRSHNTKLLKERERKRRGR